MTWIFPQPLISHFVPVTAELTSDSDEQSAKVCAQLLMRRSKPSPANSFLREWKAGRLTLLRFGLISNPSLGKAFEIAWTSSLAATHVSHSQPLENGSEKKTQDISGPTSQTEFGFCDPNSVFLKTSKDTSVSDSEMSLKSWDALVTLRRGEYSARVKSARLTSGNESLSWPTATTRDWKDTGDMSQSMIRKDGKLRMDSLGRVVQANHSTNGSRQESWATATVSTGAHRQADGSMTPKLDQQVKAWATPRAGKTTDEYPETWKARQEKGNVATMPLTAQVKAWSTPQARDWKEGSNPQPHGLQQNQLPQQAGAGKLNPRWVETLMGLPVGWVMPSCKSPVTIEPTNCASSATESSPPPQH
jgi:hypothetical protein